MERSQSVNDIRDVEEISKKVNNKIEERKQNSSRTGNNCDCGSTSNKKKVQWCSSIILLVLIGPH